MVAVYLDSVDDSRTDNDVLVDDDICYGTTFFELCNVGCITLTLTSKRCKNGIL